MCVYGDIAYPLRVNLQAPFRNVIMTLQMEALNASMSTVQESVEWLFNDIINCFKFMDFKKNLKIGLSCTGKMYVVCTILRNTLKLVCMAARHLLSFNWNPPAPPPPPSLEKYFS